MYNTTVQVKQITEKQRKKEIICPILYSLRNTIVPITERLINDAQEQPRRLGAGTLEKDKCGMAFSCTYYQKKIKELHPLSSGCDNKYFTVKEGPRLNLRGSCVSK